MAPKHLVTIVLLAFVAATVVWLVVAPGPADGETATTAETAPGAAPAGNDGAGTDGASAAPASATTDAAAPRFVAWYLHSSMRCRTCRTIQSGSEEAIATAFAADLREGRLAWRTANFEEPAYAALAKRVGVSGSSLVITEMRGMEPLRFRVLDGTWERVDDKRALGEYVVEEVDAFLRADGAGEAK